MRGAIFFVLASATFVSAQTVSPQTVSTSDTDTSVAHNASDPAARQMTVPAGTQVLLHLRSPIDTKTAKVGDGVYCQTSFPVTQDNVAVIPAGTYVKGKIAQVKRAGKIKGRAEILFNFTTMIFPNGYTIDLPGALENAPGSRNSTVKADSQKGKDAGTVAKTGATGAVIGAVASGGKGAGIGGLAGAAVGLGQVLFTRGQDVRIDQNTALEMVLERPLTVDVMNATPAQAENSIRPRVTNGNRLPMPGTPAAK
jgi:hypothetical protein